MPVLENVQVSLREILEVHGEALEEWELWGVLYQTVQAVQDIFLKGQACKDGKPQFLVTPDNLLCSSRGRVTLNVCLPDEIKGTPYWCQELTDGEFCSENSNIDKIYVFTIGQTIHHAAYYEGKEKNQKRLSPLLRTIFQSMCQIDVDLRRQLSEIAEVCNLHAGKHMNEYTFAKAVSKLHRDVLGSLPENEILAQVDHDFVIENDDVQSSKEVQPDIDYSSKYLPYGQRLGYHPEFSSTSPIAKKAKTPKERWKEAYQKVVSRIRKSKRSAWNTDEVLSSWKKHKAQQSIFRVYEELAERRRMLELLRLSINIGPCTPSDVEKNPLLTTGLKPKTIAELVLLLQRPTKPTAITSNPSSEVPIGTEDISTKITDSLTNVPCSSKDCDSYEKPFYNIDKVALSQPFSACNSELHPYQGPEFIINKIKPHIRLVPFCSDKEFHQSAFTVVVTLLTGEALDIECVSSVTGKQLYQAVADHLKLRERYLFGLAYLHGDEHIFIEKKQHMFDLLHSSSAVSKNVIQMHFRVKFYLDDVHLMRTPHLRHLYYLQLRNDFLSDNFYCDLNTAWTLGGLALQAEFGNYNDSMDHKEYFLLDHYLSYTCIKQLNKCDVKTKLRDYHLKLKGISRELAELKFIQGMIQLSEYGYHFHKVFQDKRNLSSGVWLGIHSKGIDVFEKVSGKKTVCQSYPWQNIKRISFCKKYFCIAPRAESYTGKHVVYRFYTSVMNRSQYLFNISMAHHKFFLKLRTVSKASEIFIEDLDEEYLYFCDKSGLEKEVGCDLYDTKGKFQLKSKTLRHKTSSQNDLEFLNEPYTAEVSKPKRLFKFKVKPGSLNSSNENGTPVLITRSSSFPNPMKKKLASRNSSTLPRTSCGKRTMKFVKLYKDPNCGFGMVITCGNTYDTVLHGAFVERVLSGSPADLDGNIAPGDQIMSVNGTDVQNDHFLTVVDLIHWSTSSLDIVIAKNQSSNLTNNFKKDIVERPFTKSKAWIVGNEKFKEAMPPIKAEDIHNGNEIPVPKPRKKWLEQEQTLNCVEPDLTLNHSSNANLDSRKKSSDFNNITRDNIPDIIASQMRQTLSSINSDLSSNTSEVNTESCELNTLVQEDTDSNYLLPGEVFHVVLDKKGGSLGLNIYQGSESCSDQRYIYIHSVIPNGAADLDGRIKPGDKLLEVNSVPLDNLSYQEVVTKLRISPQVAHLVLEKGSLMEVDSVPPKEHNSVAANGLSNNKIANCDSESVRKRKESSASAEACFDGHRDCDAEDQITYSSLPVVSNTPKESAKDCRNVCSDFDLSSPIHAKATPTTPYPRSLTSYSSTPNLAENSDEDDLNGSGGFLYRNRSTECLNTPHFLRPHQALLDFYQNYSYVRGSACSLHEIPAVPIRKKKLKKLDDIYNYSNSDNTFEVSVRKSSRGLGLSIFGGVDAGRDHFSQLIRIRKLFPLQPALECGKLMLGDVILEVNGTKMVGLTNTEALEVLRCAPTDVVLKVFRPSKSLIPSFSTYKGGIWPFFDSSSSSASSSLSRGENNCYNVETGEFEVTLIKRGGSLGFSISCKESSSESQQEGIFVKALVREPAISDGRIHPGDKILQVNGTKMSSMSHAEAIEFIRKTPDTVTLKLLRNDLPATPGYKDLPATPGYNEEEYSISKPLRWEAVGFLNDRLKHKESSDEGSTPKRKLKRGKHNKAEMFSNASSNTSTESDTSSSSGQELILEEKQEDLSLEGVGLQRNQRPKSLDMLNSSDRKRCPTLDDDAFHRQSSVMCANVEGKGKVEDGSASTEKKTTLLKWRGSTLPHTDEVDGPAGLKSEVLSSNGSEAADSVSDDEKPVPFPRTTSCASEWVHTFNVDLDRGWQSRLGFSLYDAPPDSPGSPRSHLLKAAEVKAVYPNSLAEKDGRIKVGDRLIAVNNESLIDLSASVVIDILRKTRGLIRMVFCRLEIPT